VSLYSISLQDMREACVGACAHKRCCLAPINTEDGVVACLAAASPY
jgi:hypothetical protein